MYNYLTKDLNSTINERINYRSWRIPISNYAFISSFHHDVKDLESSRYPSPCYSLYSKQYGKQHSQYPKF